MAGISAKKNIIRTLYAVSFLTSAHYAFVAYINSSYLSNFIDRREVGILYALSSLLTILAASRLPKLLKTFGHFKTSVSLLFVDMFSILSLAVLSSPLLAKTSSFELSDGIVLVYNTNASTAWIPAIATLSFIIFQISLVLNYIILDIYLEEFSKESETGDSRGWFLTILNTSFVFAPFIVGKIIDGTSSDFWKVYIISATLIFLSVLIVVRKFKNLRDINYHSPPFLQTAKKISADKNISSIYLSSLLLSFFYAWMVIYTPIYLHENIGFDWNQIGIIFGIMLMPFVLLQIPLGKIADKLLGEKEILVAGFAIIATSTAALTFISEKSIIVWSLALFATRVGAAAIEVMNDTYFFKKVKPTDSDIISFYRNASPIAYIIGPILASLSLYFFDPKYLFLILGVIMLSGVKFSLSIEDTL